MAKYEKNKAYSFDLNADNPDLRCSACIDPHRKRPPVSWDGKQHLNLFDLGDTLETSHEV